MRAHSKNLAGAVVAQRNAIKGLGFDIEMIKIPKYDISRHICTESENSWLHTQTDITAAEALILIFSIKEALYKCIFQATFNRPGFKDITLTFDIASRTANIKFRSDSIFSSLTVSRAKFYLTKQFVFAGVMMTE